MPVLAPGTLDEVLSLLGRHPGSVLLSGGTDVMVEINMARRPAPPEVVALRRVEELRGWSHDPAAGTVTIGAAEPYASMERPPLSEQLPALAESARTVGSPQIRAAGTLGGNLGTASPAGDGLPVLYALDAVVHLRRVDGQRDLPVADFIVGVKRNALAPGELITGVTLPLRRGWQGFAKVGVRNAMVIAVASACLAVDRDNGTVALALGAVAPTVVRCPAATAWLAGETDLTAESPAVTTELAREFGRRAAADARPIDDHRSTAAYRAHAVGVLASRLLRRAAR